MAISEKLRSSIYRKLIPVIGEEEAAAFVSYLPARDVEEPATKEVVQLEAAYLRAEMAELRTDLETGLAGVRIEIADVRTDMHKSVNRLLVTLVTSQIAITGLAVAILKI